MSGPRYDPDDPTSIGVSFWCRRRQKYGVSFLGCPRCPHFPCRQLTDEDVAILHVSPLLRAERATFIARRTKMYILRYNDGTSQDIEELDLQNPDPELLREVKEVLVVAKILVPKITLVPKPKEERERIVAAAQKAKGRKAAE